MTSGEVLPSATRARRGSIRVPAALGLGIRSAAPLEGALRRRRRRSRHRLSPSAFANSFARGRRGASLKRPRRVHGGAHVPSAARLASRLGDARSRRSLVAAAARKRLADAATVRARRDVPGRRSTSMPSSNARGRVRTPAGSVFSASFRERWFREGSGEMRGSGGRRSRASRRGPREGLLVRRGRAGFSRWRGGGVGGATRELARGDGRASAAPPETTRAADDDLVVVVAVATRLCRCRSSRRAVGARVLGSVLEVEVEGDGSSAEISRADASADVHHRSSLADASSARDGARGPGRLGDRGVSFAPLGRRPSLLARPRARARAPTYSARVTSRGGSTIRRRIPSTNAPTSSASLMTV